MNRIGFLLLGVLLLIVPVAADAEPPSPSDAKPLVETGVDLDWFTPPPGLSFTSSPGTWLEYRLTETATRTVRTFTLACLGREPYKGRMGSWVELSTVSRSNTPVVIQALMTSSPDARPQILRLLVRAGDFHSVEYPVAATPPTPPPVTETTWTDLGEETITVTGGSFATQVYRVTRPTHADQTLWISPSLSPFGLVRAVSASHELELIAYGRNRDASWMVDPYPLPANVPTAKIP